MQTVGLRRIFILAGIISLFASYLGIWFRFINDPAERTGSDFIHFYSAGRIAQSHGAAHVYDLKLQHDVEEQQVGFPLAPEQVLPYNHLPFLIPILQIVVGADYVSSFYRWILMMGIIYIAGILTFSRILEQAELERGSVLTAAIGGILFLPVFVSLMNGQDTALLFLGAALWVYGLISGKPILAGIGLSLTTVRPQIALVLALPMFFSQRRVFWGFAIGSGLLAIGSFAILGLQGTREFIDMLLLSAGGDWYGMKQYAMFNLIGLLLRVFPWLSTATVHLIGWVVYGLAIAGLSVLWARRRDSGYGPVGLTVTLALFVAPHLHFHDLALLLLPVYELMRTSSETSTLKTSIAITIPIAISLLLLVGNISPYLQYTIPYLIMLALALYPYFLKRECPKG